MSYQKLIIKGAVAAFAFSTVSGLAAMGLSLLPSWNREPKAMAIYRYGSVALGVGALSTGIALFVLDGIEVAELKELLKLEPRSVPEPCKGCRHFYGLEDEGVEINCIFHPQGWHDGACPDWEGFPKPVPVPASCQGCDYFYGKENNGVTLHCTPHPYGWQQLDEECPDRMVSEEEIKEKHHVKNT